MLKVSAFYLEKQKSFIPKNMPREIQMMAFAVLIFREGFVTKVDIFGLPTYSCQRSLRMPLKLRKTFWLQKNEL